MIPEYMNHWRIIGKVLTNPKYYPALGTEPESYRCIVEDAGKPENRIVLRWDNPEEWPAVVAELHEGNRVYIEGELELSIFYSQEKERYNSILFNVVKRWQVEPPEDTTLNEWVVVARLRYDPAQQPLPWRNIVRLVFEWPEQHTHFDTPIKRQPRMHFAQAYLYDELADEARLSMAAGDRVFIVGIASRDVWEEGDKHRAIMHAWNAGLGVENNEEVWYARLRIEAEAGQVI